MTIRIRKKGNREKKEVVGDDSLNNDLCCTKNEQPYKKPAPQLRTIGSSGKNIRVIFMLFFEAFLL
jgi:hypothetical protein